MRYICWILQVNNNNVHIPHSHWTPTVVGISSFDAFGTLYVPYVPYPPSLPGIQVLYLHVPVHIPTSPITPTCSHPHNNNKAARLSHALIVSQRGGAEREVTSTASFYPEHPERYSPDSDIIMSGMLDSSLIVHARRTEYYLPT